MPQLKTAKANVPFIRQETQFSCMAASLSACLRALGKDQTEADVNRVMGAGPLRGATWESLTGAAQYFGMRSTLVVPATLTQLKNWTDQGIPVVIAYNPENRPWSHASVVYDVTGEGDDTMIHVMDPNIPDPDRTVRVYKKADFYKIWSEKVGDSIIIRRPACAIEREVTPEGRQVMASTKKGSQFDRLVRDLAGIGGDYVAKDLDSKERMSVLDFIVRSRIRTPRNPYTEARHRELDEAQETLIRAGLQKKIPAAMVKKAEASDCEKDYRAGGLTYEEYVRCLRRFGEEPPSRGYGGGRSRGYGGYGGYSRPSVRPSDLKAAEKVKVLDALLAKRPNDFLRSVRDQLIGGRALSPKQNEAVRKFLRDPEGIVLFGGTPPAPKPEVETRPPSPSPGGGRPSSKAQQDYILSLLRQQGINIPTEDEVRNLSSVDASALIDGLKNRRGVPVFYGNGQFSHFRKASDRVARIVQRYLALTSQR